MHRRSLGTAFVSAALVFGGWSAVALAQEKGSSFPFDSKRSPTIGHRGVVATSQPLASLAGLDILKRGGNAIDAAIATAAVLTVTEPQSTALGGDMFAIVYLDAEKKLVGLNGSGRSSYSMTLEALQGRLNEQDMDRIGGIYSVSVPGAVDGWFSLLEEYGTMTMAEVLEPAIYYAEHGFHVTERIGEAWAGSEVKLLREPSAAATWLVDGKAPRIGDLFVNPRSGQDPPDDRRGWPRRLLPWTDRRGDRGVLRQQERLLHHAGLRRAYVDLGGAAVD